VTKSVQFDKKLQNIWGVWCKGVQCSMISELKQIKISSLKSWTITFEMKKSFVKPYLCTHHVPNHSKWKKYEAGTKEGSRTIFVKTFEVNYHLFNFGVCFALFFYF
jgi:hypothetical protein